jgi:hypothetical protein
VERPRAILSMSNTILMREQFSLRTAWFGQHFLVAGYFGGAVRNDCSSVRQSPRLAHGGDKHVSLKAGTHTSLSLHSCTEELPSAIQFGNPHHRLEHFVSFFSPPHRQELQRFVSKTSSVEKEHFGGEFESTEREEKKTQQKMNKWMKTSRQEKRRWEEECFGKFKLSLVEDDNRRRIEEKGHIMK